VSAREGCGGEDVLLLTLVLGECVRGNIT
jgi:hypothetical protein